MPKRNRQDVDSKQASPQPYQLSEGSADTVKSQHKLIAPLDETIARSKKLLAEVDKFLRKQREKKEQRAKLQSSGSKNSLDE